MKSYSGKVLEQYLDTKNDWLLKKLNEEINFQKTSRDKKIAYFWFEIQPDSFDIALGDVSFHNSSVGYHFIRGSDLFPDAIVTHQKEDLNIFFLWFSKCFIKAGGKSLKQKYLISCHDDPNYYSLQLSRWLTDEEIKEISTRKTSSILEHKSTGLQFTFPVDYQNRHNEEEEEISDDSRYVHFAYDGASFEVRIDFSDEDADLGSLSRNAFFKKKTEDLQNWKRSLQEDGLKYLHESNRAVCPECPSLRVTSKNISGQLQVNLCFFARDREDEDAVYRFSVECKNYESRHEPLLENMVTHIGEKEVSNKKKWWKW